MKLLLDDGFGIYKIKHWRAFSAEKPPKAAPVLEFYLTICGLLWAACETRCANRLANKLANPHDAMRRVYESARRGESLALLCRAPRPRTIAISGRK